MEVFRIHMWAIPSLRSRLCGIGCLVWVMGKFVLHVPENLYLCLDETLTESDRTCAKNGLTTDLSWLVKY